MRLAAPRQFIDRRPAMLLPSACFRDYSWIAPIGCQPLTKLPSAPDQTIQVSHMSLDLRPHAFIHHSCPPPFRSLGTFAPARLSHFIRQRQRNAIEISHASYFDEAHPKRSL